jgi:vacuolar-type H+-ATPase subunit H
MENYNLDNKNELSGGAFLGKFISKFASSGLKDLAVNQAKKLASDLKNQAITEGKKLVSDLKDQAITEGKKLVDAAKDEAEKLVKQKIEDVKNAANNLIDKKISNGGSINMYDFYSNLYTNNNDQGTKLIRKTKIILEKKLKGGRRK